MAFDITSVLKTAPGMKAQESITYLPLETLDPDPENFYSLDGLEELAGNIELIGLQQPLRVRPGSEPGRYIIVSGHRRRAACMMIRDGGSDQFAGGMPCIIEYGEASAAMRELRLIYANAATRQMTATELSRQAERVEALLYELKNEGVEFPGRMRDHVAEACRVSKTKLARLHAIRKNLSAWWLDRFDAGELSEELAYQISRLPADIQAEAGERMEAGKQKKLPIAVVVEKVNRNMDPYLVTMPCAAHAGQPDCHHKAEKILRSVFVPHEWQVCGAGTCCRDCYKSKDCSSACQECKDRRKLAKAVEEENAAKRKAEEKARQDTYKAQRRNQAKRVLRLAEAAGVTEAELPRKWTYEKPYSLKQIRKFAAGDFGDDYYYDGDLIPDQVGTVKLWAKKLMCSVDELLGLSVPAPKTAAEPVSGSDTKPRWETGAPTCSGLYAIKYGPGAEEGRKWTSVRVAVWTGDAWVTAGPGVPIRENVYGWYQLPEV